MDQVAGTRYSGMNRSIPSAALAMLLALGGCVTASAKPEPMPLTSWTFVSIDGRAPVAKTTSLRIYEGRIAANVGCNGMGANAKLIGGRIVAGPVISTQMYCEGVMEQERAVGALLRAKPKMTVRGTTMTLTGGGHSAQLRRED